MADLKVATQRFFSKVNKTKTCWLWTASLRGGGYGYFWFNGHTPAHRFSWLLHKGDIPRGLYVLHKCDIRACVNPDHLFLGTHDDNMRDMKEKGRQVDGMRAACSKLNRDDVLEIRSLKAQGWSLSQLARRYSITEGSVGHIIKGRRWSDV